MNFPLVMQVYSTVAMAGLAANADGPIEVLWDDFKLYDSPPVGAWAA
jgi:hypothetical protein